jgi:hypothetical protein
MLPAATDIVGIILGESNANELQKVPLAGNTVRRRI